MRVTSKMLEAKVDSLNALTNNSLETWKVTDKGVQGLVGNYHISQAYGGVALYQIANNGGGVHDIFNRGHMPKKELAGLIDAYMAGIQYIDK